MDEVQVGQSQARAFDLLAEILHTRRDKVLKLVGQDEHPLPLPFRKVSSTGYELDANYRRTLYRWVQEERAAPHSPASRSLNFERIVQELTADAGANAWSVEDKLESFPPGYFLG